MKKLIVFLTILVPSTSILAGGPWPQPKGKGYFKLSEWWIIFDQHYTDQGLTDPNTTMGLFNTSIYAEYGLGQGFTAILNAPIFSRNYSNNLVSNTTKEVLTPGEAINSIGDIDLALKYSIWQGTIPVSVTLQLGLPIGITAGGSQENLQTGDGEFNQMIKLDAGYSLSGKSPVYFAGYVGFNNRSNDFSDEIRVGGEIGLGLAKKKLWVSAKLDLVESLKNGGTAETVTSTSVFANNSEFLSLGLEASYYLTNRLGVSVGTAGAIRGEIIAAAPSYSVGVFYDLSK